MPIVMLLGIAACGGNGSETLGTHALTSAPTLEEPGVSACAGSRIGQAQCDALVRLGTNPNVPGLSATNLEAAYKLTSHLNLGGNQKVAIVTVGDNPNVTSDVQTYRVAFALPVPAHLKKYNQLGQQFAYPPGNVSWGLNTDMAAEMISASCPKCHILVVEANSANWSDLQTAEAEAVTLHAKIIENGFSGTGANVAFFSTPHITYVADSGDAGYGIEDPADFASVVSVGGTVLTQAPMTPRGWTEKVWNGTGAGCSTVTKPAWQGDPGCTFRTANDVSAEADLNVAIYDSYTAPTYTGWLVAGGTNVASGLVAGIFGLAGNATAQNGGQTFWIAAHQAHLYPILSGSDGSCGTTWPYLCAAGTAQYGNYSGPSGWGSPKGIGAF
ncbi:MAG TPA: hypothetical protein VGX91_07440 [Candidatus Cybelea sp.]|jgi:hypothetical protein|nr:hypothetical protein [Candidatus Cybelea sp.]